MPDRPVLLLLDGHSLAYRAFYALPVENFATTTGQPTNAVYGFISMLINAVRDEQPSHLAVAFDVSRKTFRSEQFAEYKANRSASPKEFAGQVDLIREVLEALGVAVVAVDGFEADDVIATLATQAGQERWETRILTGDRDCFQLVGADTTVLYPKRGVSELERMTPQAVQDRYGLSPSQYPDFAALRGDPSDNLPNIPGVGEKTATKWLQQYGSLDGLVEHVDEVGGKVGTALRDHLAQVLTNRRLTELVRSVPLEVELADLRLPPYEPARIDQIFDTLQFRVLRERLPDAWPGSEPTQTVARAEFEVGALDAREVANWLSKQEAVALASDATLASGTARLSVLGLAGDGAYWVELDQVGPDATTAISDWLADPERAKFVHDAKPLLHAAHARGWPVAGITCDTELAAYLAQPGRRTFGLEDVATQVLGEIPALGSDSAADGQLALDADVSSLGQRLAREAETIRRLAPELLALLADRESTSLLTDLELPVADVLVGMEADGIAVDAQHLAALAADFRAAVADSVAAAHESVGHPFNLGSPKQLQQILFDELGLPKTKKIKTGYTTDADALTGLYAKTEHPVLMHLLAHRDATRLLSTVEGLQRSVAKDGRIHTTFRQAVAATGRLSSTDPNLQNIPVRTEAGRRIRAAFVPGAGYEALLTADYSQIELRIMAHASRDERLIEAFSSGEDLHTSVARMVFGVEAADVDAEMRSKIKAMSYGLAYGLSSYGLSQQLGVETSEAAALDGGVLQALWRHPRLSAQRCGAGAAGWVHADVAGTPALLAGSQQ